MAPHARRLWRCQAGVCSGVKANAGTLDPEQSVEMRLSMAFQLPTYAFAAVCSGLDDSTRGYFRYYSWLVKGNLCGHIWEVESPVCMLTRVVFKVCWSHRHPATRPGERTSYERATPRAVGQVRTRERCLHAQLTPSSRQSANERARGRAACICAPR